MEVLRHVPAFERLSEAQLRTMKLAMSSARYDGERYIFEQGDDGDTFYLITTGVAEVLYVDPNDPSDEEVCVALLQQSDCFGEMALLRDERRSVSIMAKGTLFVLYITRTEFEAALGQPLAMLNSAATSNYMTAVHAVVSGEAGAPAAACTVSGSPITNLEEGER